MGAVDEDLIAEQPGGADRCLREVQRAVVLEALVLDDQGDVVDAVVVRQPEPGTVRIVEDEHPRDPAVDVVLGRAVRVRVVPEGRRGLVDRPPRRPGLAGRNRLVRATVGRGREVHSVPVDRRGLLREAVLDVDHHLIAPCCAKRRRQVGAVRAPGRRELARKELGTSLLQLEVEHLAARVG
jgi:hypothetical protein